MTQQKPREPDAGQAAAVAMRLNGTVSAGAGSGKTTVLAARYIDLIATSQADLASILVLTFTRKAAAEMYTRIRDAVTTSSIPAVAAQAGRFSEASIQTLDSFCGTILRSVAYRYGYPADFVTDDEALATIAEDEALRYLLEERQDPILRELCARQGFTTAWRSLFALAIPEYAGPGTPEGPHFALQGPRIAQGVDGILDTILGRLRELTRDVLSIAAVLREKPNEDCAEAIRFFASLDSQLATCPRGAGVRIFSIWSESALQGKEADLAEGRPALPGIPEDILAGIATLRELAAPLSGLKLSRYKHNEEQGAIKAAAKEARDMVKTILGAADTLEDLPLQLAVLDRMDKFARRYREAARRAGLMGFRDVARCAIDCLAEDPELRRHWKARFRYIMVDEFQDNNEDQKNLLYLLAEREDQCSPGIPRPADLVPDKLFFVGDDKQSIYRFRGADVAVFRRLGRELAGGRQAAEREPQASSGLSPGRVLADGRRIADGFHEEHRDPGGAEVRLATNYRSEPALVDFFNQAFARILGSPDRDFEAAFADIGSRPPTPGLHPTIRYLLYEPPATKRGKETRDDDEDDTSTLRSEPEILAHAVAGFVRAHVQMQDLMVATKTGLRPARYEDFAILLRSTPHQYLLERFFRLADIPYTTTDICGLYVESPVNDLHSLLRLALMPEDRIALATYLRSPFVRCSDDAFVLVLDALRQFPDAEAFAPDHSPDSSSLNARDRERLERGSAILATVRAMADRVPLPELLSWIWYSAGLRLAILSRPDAHPYLEHFEFLFDRAGKASLQGRNLASFLDTDIEPFLGEIEKQSIDDLQRDHAEGVKIMTIHKSKGLEFPIVIIPWMNTPGQPARQGDSWYVSEETGISLNLKPWNRVEDQYLNIFFQNAQQLEQDKRRAETKRLFYVACTRAISHLVFAGHVPQSADNGGFSFHSLLAGGDGKRGKDGRFAALEDCVDMETIPALDTAGYIALFRGTKTWTQTEFAAAYPKVRATRRVGLRRRLGVTALEPILASLPPESLPAGMPTFRGGSGSEDGILRFEELSHETILARLEAEGIRDALAELPMPGELTADSEGADSPALLTGIDPAADTAMNAAADASAEAAAVASADAGHFGTLCHAYIQKIIETVQTQRLEAAASGRLVPTIDFSALPKVVTAKADDYLEDFRESAQRMRGLTPQLKSLLDAVVKDVRSLARGFFRQPFAARILAYPELETEKSFLYPAGEGFVLVGRMDLVARSPEGILVLDFKTDRTAYPGKHQFQLWIYRQALQALYPGQPVESHLVWLRGPALQMVDAEFPEGLPLELARRAAEAES